MLTFPRYISCFQRSLGALASSAPPLSSFHPSTPASIRHSPAHATKQEGLNPLFSGRALSLLLQYHQENLRHLRYLVQGTDLATLNLYQIIARTHRDPAQARICHYAGQAWNVDFFLNGLIASSSPSLVSVGTNLGNPEPTDELRARLAADFGTLEEMQEEFMVSAKALLSNGWTWLVRRNDGRLSIINTFDGGTPLFTNQRHLKASKATDNINSSVNTSGTEEIATPPSESGSAWNAWAALFAKKEDGSKITERSVNSSTANTISMPSQDSSSSATHSTGINATLTPIFGLNMWEHAFVGDYGLDRERYINNYWKCLNWNRAAVILNLY